MSEQSSMGGRELVMKPEKSELQKRIDRVVEFGESRRHFNDLLMVVDGCEGGTVEAFSDLAITAFKAGNKDKAERFLDDGRAVADKMADRKYLQRDYVECLITLSRAGLEIQDETAVIAHLAEASKRVDSKSAQLSEDERVVLGIKIAGIGTRSGDMEAGGRYQDCMNSVGDLSVTHIHEVVKVLIADGREDLVQRVLDDPKLGGLRRVAVIDECLRGGKENLVDAFCERVVKTVDDLDDFIYQKADFGLSVDGLLERRGSLPGGSVDDKRVLLILARKYARSGAVELMRQMIQQTGGLDQYNLSSLVENLEVAGRTDEIDKLVSENPDKVTLGVCKIVAKLKGFSEGLGLVCGSKDDQRDSLIEGYFDDLVMKGTVSLDERRIKAFEVFGKLDTVDDDEKRLALVVKLGRQVVAAEWKDGFDEDIEDYFDMGIGKIADGKVANVARLDFADLFADLGNVQRARGLVTDIFINRHTAKFSPEEYVLAMARLAKTANKCGLAEITSQAVAEVMEKATLLRDRIDRVSLVSQFLSGRLDDKAQLLLDKVLLDDSRSEMIADALDDCLERQDWKTVRRVVEIESAKDRDSRNFDTGSWIGKMADKGHAVWANQWAIESQVNDGATNLAVVIGLAESGGLDVCFQVFERMDDREKWDAINTVINVLRRSNTLTDGFCRELLGKLDFSGDGNQWVIAGLIAEKINIPVDVIELMAGSSDEGRKSDFGIKLADEDLFDEAKVILTGIKEFPERYILGRRINVQKTRQCLTRYLDSGAVGPLYKEDRERLFGNLEEELISSDVVPGVEFFRALNEIDVTTPYFQSMLELVPSDIRGETVKRSRLMRSDRLLDVHRDVLSSEAKRFLETTDLDIGRFAQTWRDGGPNFYCMRLRSLEIMGGIEARRHGAVKVLNKRYNLIDFGRYSVDQMCKQYDMRDDKGRYGIAVVTLDDHNGAFAWDVGYEKQKTTIGEFFVQIGEAVQPDVNLVVTEASNRFGVARRLLEEAKRRGKGKMRPSAFRVYGGHGDPAGMNYGKGDEGRISVTDFEYQLAEKPEDEGKFSLGYFRVSTKEHGIRQGMAQKLQDDLYEPGSSSLLISCSTGTFRGLAQVHSRATGTYTEGPEREYYPDEIIVSKTGPFIQLHGISSNVKSAGYVEGKEVFTSVVRSKH